MVELRNKYQMGVRRFGLINWIGAYSLYKKETLRFLNVFGQTIIGPIGSAILFLLVISIALGKDRFDVLGVPYIQFLAPGLIGMQVIQQSFSHSSSSLLMGKVMQNIVDLIGAPLSSFEVTLSIILASITRAIIIALLSVLIFSYMADISIQNYTIFMVYLFLNSFILGAAGFIAGLWADKFDNMATVTNFIIVPLSFLSGTFYSIDSLPPMLIEISYYNPFFHMIDGFRYSFIGTMDGSLSFGIIYLTLIALSTWFLSFYLYKKGYKIKS